MARRLPILLLSCLIVSPVTAAGGDRAGRLDGELTPLGAQRAGNAEGSIPAWDGGLTPERAPAGFVAGSRYVDPYSSEAPLLTITRATLDPYRGRLTNGQIAAFAALPETFSLPIYPSHRSAAAPAAFYAGTRRNGAGARLGDDGAPIGAGAGLPFPVLGDEPEDGLRLFWNQRLRWRGVARDRVFLQASVSRSSDISLFRFHERAKFNAIDTAPSSDIGRVLQASLLGVLAPQRLFGALKLEHETLDKPWPGWQRSPGPDTPSLTKTSEVGNDVPVLGSDGLYDEDQREGYVGAPDRYQWKRLGTREIYVPYNAYRLHAEGLKPADLLAARHLSPAPLRYELHRVHVLDARLKPGMPGAWPRRTFYIDEDSSQILLVDLYGRSDRIERVQEVHTMMAYDKTLLLPILDVVYDLVSSRYLASGLDNEERESVLADIDAGEFTPDHAKRWWRKLGTAVPARK